MIWNAIINFLKATVKGEIAEYKAIIQLYMAESTLRDFKGDLKKDLQAVSSLSFNDRKSHLETVSKPLLKLLFQNIGHENNEISDSETSVLSGLLIGYMNYDHDASVLALMSLYRLKELNNNLSTILEGQIDDLLDTCSSKYDVYRVFKIVTQLFTFDPLLCSELFSKKSSFISLLTNETTLLSNDISNTNIESIKNINTILILFSTACVEESSRSLVATLYINIILKCLTLPKDNAFLQTKCYAATTTIKMWRMIKPETLENNSKTLSLNNLSDIIIESISHGLETSVEGLSLLCTNIQIKNKIRNEETLNILFSLIGSKEHATYGVISVLTSLTLPNRLWNIQQRSMVSLKDSNSISGIDIYTNQNSNAAKKKDDVNMINFVVEKIIKEKLFSKYIITIFKSLESSKGLVGQCLKLIYNILFPDIELLNDGNDLLKDNKFGHTYVLEIVQIIKLLTAYLIGTSQNMKYNHEEFIKFEDGFVKIPEKELEYRLIAIKSLCSPIISNNVELFYGKNDEEFALSPVPFLLEILVQYDIDTGTSKESKQTPFTSLKSEVISTFDVYYAFASLAAIASLSFQHVKSSIFSLGFDSIVSSLNSSDEKIQFASLQLLNEICDLPLCIAKFFNWENTTDIYYQNFAILCYLLQSCNYDSQCISLQIFYTVSRFDIVAEKLCNSELFCSNLNKIFQNQDSEDALIYYSLLVLSNLVPMIKSAGSNHLNIFNSSRTILLNHTKSENKQISESAKIVVNYLN